MEGIYIYIFFFFSPPPVDSNYEQANITSPSLSDLSTTKSTDADIHISLTPRLKGGGGERKIETSSTTSHNKSNIKCILVNILYNVYILLFLV